MVNNKKIKESIVKRFSKYCSKCNGSCCKKGVFSVFSWEMKNLPLKGKIFEISKSCGERGSTKDIVMKDRCIFLGNKGCVLAPKLRTTDCITFPFYPKLKKVKNGLKIEAFFIHEECPFSKEVLKDKELFEDVHAYWDDLIKKVPSQEIFDWIGQDEYWDEWYKKALVVNC
jgi:hypothetical protein